MLHRYLVAETLKLRRSLVVMLVTSAPLLVMIICVLIGLNENKPVPLDRYAMTGAAFWAFAMLPLTVTALSVLMAQMEHGPRTWDHLLALPGARRWLFLAKMLIMMVLVAAMSLWLYALLIVGGSVIAKVHAVSTLLDAMALRDTIAGMAVASLLMCVIQLWTALRFRSFIPPLVLGILGTFVSVAAASAREGAYFPRLMPLQMLSSDLAKQAMAFRIGALGGCAALLVMLADLARREA